MAKGSPLDSALEALVKATSKKKKLNKVVSALSVVLDELKSWVRSRVLSFLPNLTNHM